MYVVRPITIDDMSHKGFETAILWPIEEEQQRVDPYQKWNAFKVYHLRQGVSQTLSDSTLEF